MNKPKTKKLFNKKKIKTKKRGVGQKYRLKTKKGGVGPRDLLSMVLARKDVPSDVRKYVLEYTPKPIDNTNINRLVVEYFDRGDTDTTRQRVIDNYGTINEWDVGKVTDMSFLFSRLEDRFNENISNWNVSNVTCMDYMFFNASSFNQPLNAWNVSQVESMNSIFDNARSFNQPLNAWNVSHVKDMGCVKRDNYGWYV